jgi:NhaP-type Na+/H+ or K+/H+ antiporter
MLVVRPLAMQLATAGLPLSGAQKILLSWLAPRGIVTAAVASLFALRLYEAGVEGAGALQGLVFLTILMTVGLQGFTAAPLAGLLGLTSAAEAGDDAKSGEEPMGDEEPKTADSEQNPSQPVAATLLEDG